MTISDFLSSLFRSKVQKLAWIMYLIFVAIIIVSFGREPSANDRIAELCRMGIYQYRGTAFHCPSTWRPIVWLSVTFVIITKLLESKKDHE